jgi:hypothetical protein
MKKGGRGTSYRALFLCLIQGDKRQRHKAKQKEQDNK